MRDTIVDALSKSNAEVRSPQTARRQGVMFGSSTPKRASMKRISEVWSNVSEQTQPPVLHGETTSSGTRTPSPYGPTTPSEPLGVPAVPLNSSLSSGTVDCPASVADVGVGADQVVEEAVVLVEGDQAGPSWTTPRGLLVSASSTPAVYQAP